MDRKKLKVYTASSVGIDYFLFLNKTIENGGYFTEPIFLISESNYRRLSKASGFQKMWLRAQMYLFYPMLLIYKAIVCNQQSVFVITSNTFYAPLLTQLILRWRKIKVIHLLYDLFPDALEIAGVLRPNALFSKSLGNLMRLSQRNCDATVYLGDYLRFHAESRWGKTKISQVIDISTDLTLYQEEFSLLKDDNKLILHYGGQFGHLHDAVSLIESIKYVCESDISRFIEFNFYVSGAQTKLLENSLKGYPVKIISAVPSHLWRRDVKGFHIGLVSLSPGGASVCLPSKTYSMMAAGLAILTICPEWSDLAMLVNNSNAGWVINNSAYSEKSDLIEDNYLLKIQEKRNLDEIVKCFYNTLKDILSDKVSLRSKRKSSYHEMRNNYNIDSLSAKWKTLIEEVHEN